MLDACRSRDLRRVLDAGLRLIGLGPGLTPSGDDFMGGLLFAAYHRAACQADSALWDARAVAHFLRQARPGTNTISFTMLSDLAYGAGPEPLHRLSNALIKDAPTDIIQPAVRALTCIGHTSGWDMLTGLLAGMQGSKAHSTLLAGECGPRSISVQEYVW